MKIPDAGADICGDYANIEFVSKLSLAPLINSLDHIESCAPGCACTHDLGLKEALAGAPELMQTITDFSVLEKNQAVLNRLMSLLFPPVYWDTQYFAGMLPFKLEPFFYSPSFGKLFVGDQNRLQVRPNLDTQVLAQGRAIKAYLFVLRKFYGIDQKLDHPLICAAADPQTGLDRYFNFQFDMRFVEVHTVGGLKKLTNGERARVLENITRPEVLAEILPPQNFEFSGFTVLNATDVTESEVISGLERDLIDQETIVTNEGFERLQNRLRIFLRRPDLLVSLAAMHGEQVMLLNASAEITKSCIFGDSMHMPASAFDGTVYERIRTSDEMVLVPDVQNDPLLKKLEQDFSELEVRSLIIVPLHYQGECIGCLNVKSHEVGELGPMDALRLEQVQPVFAMAIHKAISNFEAQVQAIIKQECTAIHPSVEWRFRRAATALFEKRRQGQAAELEPIVFSGVNPLYAATDVRGSSNERNRAIAADLDDHLGLGLEVIQRAGAKMPMPILDQLAGRIENLQKRVAGGLGTGDESLVVGFMKNEVESVFDDMETLGPDVAQAISDYRQAVDPKLGTLYRRRLEFEQSVQLLNDRLASYLDAEEAAIQQTFPHYYERHRTDGVDYIIYLGQSLMESGSFNKLLLQNLRLWQIMVSCGLAWHNQDIKPSLPIALDTAHLILVQNSPMNIRFRYDEKRFDVDGAYDIRYEIIRSRLDKATVAGSGERITQPGKIALVYTHPTEFRELRRHIEYLQAEQFVTGEVERLDLNELPGVQGLKALRVSVDMESPKLAERARSMMAA